MTEFEFNAARANLTDFVIRYAARLAKDIGFSYWPAQDAPETFAEVCAEYAACNRQRREFRVFAGASDNTIYIQAEGNYAFRFWHDVTHAVFKLDFSTAGELETAAHQLKIIAERFGKGSAEHRIFYIDTVLQALYFSDTGGKFVDDQLQFARQKACVISA